MTGDRAETILSMLSVQKETTVKELARALYVSESSIRRDLSALAAKGKILRTFRGARLCTPAYGERYSFLYRAQQNAPAKEKIATMALGYIHDNDTLMMDDSTSMLFLVPHLTEFKNLTVITNCIRTAYLLCELNIRNYMIGGRIHQHNKFAYVGPFAERMVRDFHGNLALFSCTALSLEGHACTSSDAAASLRQLMIQSCERSILLCDSSKIGPGLTCKFAEVEDLDGVLCENPLPEEMMRRVGLRKRRRSGEGV